MLPDYINISLEKKINNMILMGIYRFIETSVNNVEILIKLIKMVFKSLRTGSLNMSILSFVHCNNG